VAEIGRWNSKCVCVWGGMPQDGKVYAPDDKN